MVHSGFAKRGQGVSATPVRPKGRQRTKSRPKRFPAGYTLFPQAETGSRASLGVSPSFVHSPPEMPWRGRASVSLRDSRCPNL